MFLIRSRDGRLRICTSRAATAVDHAERLQGLGKAIEVTNVYRGPCELDELHALAAIEQAGASSTAAAPPP